MKEATRPIQQGEVVECAIGCVKQQNPVLSRVLLHGRHAKMELIYHNLSLSCSVLSVSLLVN